MNDWWRRIRTAIGMGLIWAAAWACAGIVPARVAGLDSDLPFAYLFGPFGFVAGILFCAILGVIERRGLDPLSLLRVAGLRAVIGLVLSVIFPVLRGDWQEFSVFGPTLALASAVAAAASKRLLSPRPAIR